MKSTIVRTATIALMAGAAILAGAASAGADPATLLGVNGSWKSFTTGAGPDRVCYALSQPRSSLPKKAKRDPAYVLISDWPARMKPARAEPELVPGYKFKDDSTVTVQVGSDKFTFFTKNDGDSGSAWIKGTNDEQRLIEAMQRGSQLLVTGISARGTMTHDTYSLAGLGEALTKIHTACAM